MSDKVSAKPSNKNRHARKREESSTTAIGSDAKCLMNGGPRPTDSSTECDSQLSIAGLRQIDRNRAWRTIDRAGRPAWQTINLGSDLNIRHAHDLSEKLNKRTINNEKYHQDKDLFLKNFSTRSYHTTTRHPRLIEPNGSNSYHSRNPIKTTTTTKQINYEVFSPPAIEKDSSIESALVEITEEKLTKKPVKTVEINEKIKVEVDMEKTEQDSDKINDLIRIEKLQAINSARHSLRKMETLKNKNFRRVSSHSKVSRLTTESGSEFETESIFSYYFNCFLIKFNFFVMSPDETYMFIWLIILTGCCLYNVWIIIGYWRIADGIADSIYILDILVQFRTGYLEQGLLVYDSKKLAINYIKSQKFILDIFSIIPLELLEMYLGYVVPMLRFPRFFKIYRAIYWTQVTESRTLYPNVWRVTCLTHILLLLGHWFAGFYFLISKAEGFKGHWSYPEPVDEFALLPRMYLRCLYWSTLTLTTIGDLPPPETNWQYCFSIFVHYLAVFVIALIVGQVGNVITNRNASRVEFERLLDGAKQYMRNHDIPQCMQKRVQRWYDYSWSRGRMNGAGDIHSIGLLPDKLKTELALHVNLETLRKVTIFHECQPEFLHDLVLKMRAYIFTPGDMICRKGEVAREMFIIADGVLEVIGDKGQVFTKMYSGDFFGEIGILNLEGSTNKRTADVRSVGYAELFSLSKEDVLSAVRDFPDAEKILMEYGKRRLNQNSMKQNENSIFNKSETDSHRASCSEKTVSNPDLHPRITRNRSHSTDLFGFQIKSDETSVFSPTNYEKSSYPDDMERKVNLINGKKDGSYFKNRLEYLIKKIENPSELNLNHIKNILIEMNDNINNEEDSELLDDKMVLKTILC